MKIAVYILILANILFFLWEKQHNHRADPVIQAQHSSAGGIVLLTELSPAQRQQILAETDIEKPDSIEETVENTAATEPEKKPPEQNPTLAEQDKVVTEENLQSKKQQTPVQSPALPPIKLSCFEIGPFQNQKQAELWLKEHEIDGEFVNKSVKTPSSYLVYLPAPDDFAIAKNNEKMLREKGIVDLWLFRQGPMKGAISLGLFVKKQRAEKLKNQLLEKGIQVSLEARFKEEDKVFVKVQLPKQPEVLKPLAVSRCINNSGQ